MPNFLFFFVFALFPIFTDIFGHISSFRFYFTDVTAYFGLFTMSFGLNCELAPSYTIWSPAHPHSPHPFDTSKKFFFFFLIPPGRPLGPREGYDNPYGVVICHPLRGWHLRYVFFFRVASVVSLPAPNAPLSGVLHIPSGDVYVYTFNAYAFAFGLFTCVLGLILRQHLFDTPLRGTLRVMKTISKIS